MTVMIALMSFLILYLILPIGGRVSKAEVDIVELKISNAELKVQFKNIDNKLDKIIEQMNKEQ